MAAPPGISLIVPSYQGAGLLRRNLPHAVAARDREIFL
jgi:hypothetical protein